MKRFFCLAALVCASVASADDAAPATSKVTATGASPMPAVAAKVQVVQAKPPLHRHATLLGMLRRSNDVRRRLGLRPHRMNPALTKAAQDQANYMAKTGQFSHYVNGGPQYRANKYGFKGGALENIAMGTRSVHSTFGMWEASGGHYASIVSGTTDAGFGYAISPSGQTYWVGVYANRAAGDAVGESEEQIAAAIAAEKKALADAAATVDPNVAPASATEPVKDAKNAAEKPEEEPAAAQPAGK